MSMNSFSRGFLVKPLAAVTTSWAGSAAMNSPWSSGMTQMTEDRGQKTDVQVPTSDLRLRTSERRATSDDHPKEALLIARRFVRELEKAGLSSLADPVRHLSGTGQAGFGVLGPEGKGVLTISGGLASFPRDARTSDELFLLADKALLEAKRSGKNRIYLVGKPQDNITDIK